MCYHAKFGRSALKSVSINTGKKPKLGALELRSLGIRGEVGPKIHAIHHVKFGSSATKGVRVNRREPRN